MTHVQYEHAKYFYEFIRSMSIQLLTNIDIINVILW